MSDDRGWRVPVDQVELLAVISGRAAAADPAEPLSLRLCRAAAEVLGADGAAITLATGRLERVTLCTTDDVSARLEDLQEVIGEGPGVDAYRSGEPRSLNLSEGDARWPRLVDTALETVGGGVLHAFPIRPGPQVLGVATFYLSAADVDPVAGSVLRYGSATVQDLVDALGVALLAEDADLASDVVAAGPWAARAKIHQATGMVIAQLQVGATDAVALLRAHAFAQTQTLLETATAVVERRLSFDPDLLEVAWFDADADASPPDSSGPDPGPRPPWQDPS